MQCKLVPMFLSFGFAAITLLASCQAADKSETPANAGGESPQGAAVFIDQSSEPEPIVPDTTLSGRFELESQCLVFRMGEVSFRPIVPQGSRVANSILFLGDSRIELGKRVTVHGGQHQVSPGRDVPETCPRRTVLIGELL